MPLEGPGLRGIESQSVQSRNGETNHIACPCCKSGTRKGEDKFAAWGPLSVVLMQMANSYFSSREHPQKQKPYACKLLCSPLDARMMQSMQSHLSNSAALSLSTLQRQIRQICSLDSSIATANPTLARKSSSILHDLANSRLKKFQGTEIFSTLAFAERCQHAASMLPDAKKAGSKRAYSLGTGPEIS